MSVTCVLVPFAENEAEALLPADREEALQALAARAVRLRRRVGRLDAIREDLHAALFHLWDHEGWRAPSPVVQLWRLVTGQRGRVRESAGYDPFVHLFGRSLPVQGATPKDVAVSLSRVEGADDQTFVQLLAEDLRGLAPKAAELFQAAPLADGSPVEPAIRAQGQRLATALEAADYVTAFDALVRLQAWSRPVWRLDGAMLGSLLSDVGVSIETGSGADFFANALADPPPDEALAKIPKSLENFSGPGAFLSAAQVKVLAGALRLQRARIRENANAGDERAQLVLRHVRILEEAALYCESNDLALCEAAGVEWHDRGT